MNCLDDAYRAAAKHPGLLESAVEALDKVPVPKRLKWQFALTILHGVDAPIVAKGERKDEASAP
ncbi:hypothetical protein [Rhodoplanes sp. SY1]|uniref:hypothetical protein n=1 Tax=Rhodoplanes sp. SY1 TaxID=3166646 RepID=UPI0038B42CEF